MAYVISDNCVACGTCAGECPVGAISEGDIYKINPDQKQSLLQNNKDINSEGSPTPQRVGFFLSFGVTCYMEGKNLRSAVFIWKQNKGERKVHIQRETKKTKRDITYDMPYPQKINFMSFISEFSQFFVVYSGHPLRLNMFLHP